MRVNKGTLLATITGLRRFVPAAALIAVAVLVCFASNSFAQTTTGSVTGTITDQAGAAMVGVSVVVHNDDTGVDQVRTMTAEAGTYNAPLLPPGTYDITATQSGFATVQQKSLRVQVGETVRLDLVMPVASTTQQVQVTTEIPVLETEKTEASQVISENLVADLPMSSRRWDQFVLLTPGTTYDGPTGFVSFHGLNGLHNMNNLDGANNNDNFQSRTVGAGTDGYLTSGDAIREFQVSESNFSASLGQAAGGSVNSVVKSGTNDIHGDAFENLRNPIFNALDPATVLLLPKGSPFTQPVHQQNQFGGSVGGPIKKDKVFLFLNYDGYRKVTPIGLTSSTNIGALACPSEITATQCSVAKNYVTTGLLGVFPRELRQDDALGKLDYQLNKNNHLSGTFNWRNWFEPNGSAFANANNSGITAQSSTLLQDRVYIGNLTTVIGSDKVNQLIYEYRRDWTLNLPSGGGVPPQVNLGPALLFAYGQQAPIPQYIRLGVNQVNDNFTVTRGKHAIKTGVNFTFMSLQNRGNTGVPGVYTYSGALPIAGSGCPNAGAGAVFCDWLVDLYGVNVGDGKTGEHWTSFNQIIDQSVSGNLHGQLDPSNPGGGGGDQFTWATYAAYVEDTWKVRPNLTLNLGLRYDNQALPPLSFPNESSALTAQYTSVLRKDAFDFSPRLGLAWNPTKNNVFRVGFGTFFDGPLINTVWGFRLNSGTKDQTVACTPTALTGFCSGLSFPNVLWSQQAAVPSAPFSSSSLGTPGTPNGNPLTPSVLNPIGNACVYGTSLKTCSLRGVSPNFTNPRALEGEVGWERQLPGQMSMTAKYLVTRGLHLDNFWDANLAFPTATKSYDIVDTSGATQSQVTVPFFTQRIDPNVGNILSMFSNANSWYNALALTLRRPMSHDLEVLANYTLSKTTDTGEPASNTAGVLLASGNQGVLNPYDQRAENGISALDNRHRFTTSLVWEPGFNKSYSNVAETQLLGGWSFSTTITATSGSGAYSAVIGSGANQCSIGVIPTGQTCTTATQNGVQGQLAPDGGMTGALLSNFGIGMGGRVAFQPKNPYYLPGWTDMDLRIEKQFRITERYRFSLRAEAFNLFNSTLIQAVNTTEWNYAQPGAAGCPSTHTNTCMVPNPASATGFQSPTVTSGNFIGARQMQFGARFEF